MARSSPVCDRLMELVSIQVLETMVEMMNEPSANSANENTVIGVVATNGRLNKAQANKVAQMAHDGLARAVNPAHTMFDGDTIFALATGHVDSDPTIVGALCR